MRGALPPEGAPRTGSDHFSAACGPSGAGKHSIPFPEKPAPQHAFYFIRAWLASQSMALHCWAAA